MLSLISDTSITKLNVSWFVKLATLVNQSKQGVYVQIRVDRVYDHNLGHFDPHNIINVQYNSINCINAFICEIICFLLINK